MTKREKRQRKREKEKNKKAVAEKVFEKLKYEENLKRLDAIEARENAINRLGDDAINLLLRLKHVRESKK